TFRYAVMVSLFVLVMMLAIEYVTILSRGKWNNIFSEKGWVQILFAAVLGIIPGCLGTYVAVSLYIHKVIGFAALVTVMIATSGDEAFIMIKEMPVEALTIMVVLFVVAIIAGLVIHMFMKNRTLMVLDVNHMHIHPTEDDCKCFDSKNFLSQFQKISFERALLVFFGFLFLISLLTGSFGFHEWDWERTVFLIVTLIGLFIVITVPDHFLRKHLWGHVIKKHFLKIFLWTFGAFFAIAVMNLYFDVAFILQGNMFYVMVIAVLIGILPESGPHIVFIALFLQGHIPISILIANSIVQDGHGTLPLLAESRRSFVAVKLINMVFGFLAGLAGYYFGF
ncbi:MAG: putative manganese transporter, partial [Bacteroidales bacterium]|nr:putative manganese transporter [Bacteroidales bacterium]